MAGMQQIHEHTHNEKQHGFTLLEVVVVMLILAVLAGTVITSFNSGFIEENQETVALFEMSQIRDSILKFISDNPSHTLDENNLCSPADISFLITDQFDTDNDCETTEDAIDAWSSTTKTGWRGPYIKKFGNPTASSVENIEHNGSLGIEDSRDNVVVILDPYNNPYYYFELDEMSSGRIVSFGPNNTYDSDGTGCVAADNDDHVLCLR